MTENSTIPSAEEHNFTNRVVKIFLESNLSIILILLAAVVGVAALGLTPREEDPQIILILLAAVVGVEYVYSMSRQDRTIIGGSSQLRAPRLGAGSRVHAARVLPRDHPRSGGACRSTDPGIPAEPIGGDHRDCEEKGGECRPGGQCRLAASRGTARDNRQAIIHKTRRVCHASSVTEKPGIGGQRRIWRIPSPVEGYGARD